MVTTPCIEETNKIEMMNREDLKIGDKVSFEAKRADGTTYNTVMFVQELHNKNCAGLSYQPNETNPHRVYGIHYSILNPQP